MGRFRNAKTGAVVSVDDSKDERFRDGWESADKDPQSDAQSQYADLKVDELKAAIAQRNEGRKEADLVPDKGNKADLIAALEADDNKSE